MLKSKQELKISNLFLQGSIGLEGKMNDERMISQTPMVHKLDVVSSYRLVCPVTSKGGSEKRECVLSHWLVCPTASKGGSEERECVLSRWLVCPTASKGGSEERECVFSHWLVCPTASTGGSEERVRMVSAAFYVAYGGDPGKIASVILIGQNM